MSNKQKEVSPDDNLSHHAKAARAELERFAEPGQSLSMLISQDDEQHELMLPAEAVSMLMQVLEHLALHQEVSVVASDKLLTTQQVADILRVSRPYITKLIDQKKLPCEMIGSHRRIRYDDLMAYKKHTDEQRRNVLSELTAQAQDLKLGY